MTYTFTSTELTDIENAATLASADPSLWADVYLTIRIAITDAATGAPKAGVDPAVWHWVNGAEQVNRGTGPFSDFIRS